MLATTCPLFLTRRHGLRRQCSPEALAVLRADSVGDSPLGVALAVRDTMREYRRGKPIAFTKHRVDAHLLYRGAA